MLARGSPSPRQEFVAAIVRPEFDEADENIGRIGLWRPLCWLCCRLSAKTDGRMGCDHDAYISSDQRVVPCCFIGNPDAGIGTAPAKPASFLLRSGSVRISRPFARPIPTATSPPIAAAVIEMATITRPLMLRPSKVDSRSSAWVVFHGRRFKALALVIIEKRPTAHPVVAHIGCEAPARPFIREPSDWGVIDLGPLWPRCS